MKIKLSLKNRLLAIMMLLSLLQAVVLGVGYYSVHNNAVLSQVSKAAKAAYVQSESVFSQRHAEITNEINLLMVDNSFYEVLANSSERYYIELTGSKLLARQFVKFNSKDQIISTHIVGSTIPFEWHNKKYTLDEFLCSRFYNDSIKTSPYEYWMMDDESGHVFLIRQLNVAIVNENYVVQRLPQGMREWYIVLEIDPSFFLKIYEPAMIYDSSSYILMNDDGEVFLSSGACSDLDEDQLMQLSNDTAQSPIDGDYIWVNGREYMVFSHRNDTLNWRNIILIPVSALMNESNANLFVFIIISILALSVVTFLILLLVTRSIKPVTDVMQKFENLTTERLHLPANVQQGNEVTHMAYMLDSLNKYLDVQVKENHEMSRREQEATIKALEAQLNPHFLYNSLNKISFAAAAHGEGEIVRSVQELSSVLRYSINSKLHLVYFYQDYEQLERYIAVMKSEYDNLFVVYTNIEEEIYNCIVPKLFLQPFVENAILHGFRNMECGAILQIAGYRQGNNVIFEVSDNGCGIDRKTCETMFDGNAEHIGASNVNKRIHLLFGEEYGITASSESGNTTIKIVLPYLTEK